MKNSSKWQMVHNSDCIVPTTVSEITAQATTMKMHYCEYKLITTCTLNYHVQQQHYLHTFTTTRCKAVNTTRTLATT